MPQLEPGSSTWGSRLGVAVVIVAALHFGRDVLIPLALAALLAFVLDPLVTGLKRRGVPRVLAIAGVLLALLAALFGGGLLVAGQLKAMGKEAPRYQAHLSQKVQGLMFSLRQPGALKELGGALDRLERDLKVATEPAAAAKAPAAPAPQVQAAPTTPAAQLREALAALGGPLGTAGLVLVFLVLLLLNRGDLRDRALGLIGGSLHRATDALDELSRRISSYLTMQLILNAAYGVPMAAGLWLMGVPGALVWGLLAAVMRFVPYLGPVIAGLPPLLLALAVEPGWSTFFWAAGFILTLELLSNNIIEPWLYGNSTGLSALSLILAASFWTTLWGPVGLVLATPLTVCLLVLGRHVPQFAFLQVLLGSQPALDAPTRLHQRLLAGDVDDAVELALTQAEREGVQAFYEDTALPALRLACEAHGTVATAEHRERVTRGMARVLAELAEEQSGGQEGGAEVLPAAPPRVAHIGARWEIDALAAQLAAQAMDAAGVAAWAQPFSSDAREGPARWDLRHTRTVCLHYFSPEPQTHLRLLCRRLKQRWPGVRIVAALWNLETVRPAANQPAAQVAIQAANQAASQTATQAANQAALAAAVPELDAVVFTLQELLALVQVTDAPAPAEAVAPDAPPPRPDGAPGLAPHAA